MRTSSTGAWRPWTKMNATYSVEGELIHLVNSRYSWLLPPNIELTSATECSKYSRLFMKMISATIPGTTPVSWPYSLLFFIMS